jgi:biopolymer transport protein ExbD
MEMSKRAKRMERHHKRKKAATLNMVSLMDIFTILVFFLLVSSSTGEVLPSTKSIKLPESVADKKPKETLTIFINNEYILVQGRKIATIASVLTTKGLVIEPLKKELDLQAKRVAGLKPTGKPFNGEITVLGDKELPYKLLKKIMVTCTKANYGNISLAVMKKVESEG